MKGVYAMLVGIADYPPEVNRLYGCKNDVLDVDLLFREMFTTENEYRYQCVILLDDEAKRNRIIDGFSLFDMAEENDICIFYYSGHGSLVQTNAAFWTDGKQRLRSLVCYDSRFPGGYDLVDKELSYLVWKATRQKPGIHFVVIMDCCFAGSNTRTISELNRMFDENRNVKPVEEFEGFQEYVNGVPPRGRYIALSASQSDEPSKEKSINGIHRGVFTYFLTQTIRTAAGSMNYQTLIEAVKANTQHQVQLQTPQLETYDMNKDTGLFGQAKLPGTGGYFLFHASSWKISRGSMHGVKAGDVLKLDSGDKVVVTATGVNESEVSIAGTYDTSHIYNVFPERTIKTLIRYYLTVKDDSIASWLRLEMTANHYEGIDLDGNAQNADFYIGSPDGSTLVITEPGDDFPLFKRMDADQPGLFLQTLEHVAKWATVANLFNPDGNKLLQAVAVDFRQVGKNGMIDDTLPSYSIDRNQDGRFAYTFENGQQKNPAFRLSVINNYPAPLFACMLYCSSDFGVTDRLLPNTFFGKDSELFAGYNSGGRMSRTVPLNIDPDYYRRGKKEITEYIIIIISQLAIDSASFNLPSLPLDKGTRSTDTTRSPGAAHAVQINKPVWGSIRIPVKILYSA